MSEDLENTLRELGPEYARVVAKLRSVNEINSLGCAKRVMFRRSLYRFSRAVSVAAMVVMALGVLLLLGVNEKENGLKSDENHTINPYLLAFHDSVDKAIVEITRTQKPDGSWGSDYLSRQNATLLEKFDITSVAYRKALRYLRSRGMDTLTDAEFNYYKQLGADFNCNQL